MLIYRGKAPGDGHWAKSRPFFIEAQLLATVLRQNHDGFFIEARLPGWQRSLGKITILLYRGTAPGNGPWTKLRSFFIEAQFLATAF